MIPLESTTVVENDGLVDTCNLYDVAPLEAFQLKLGLVETPVAPLAGEANAGAESAATVVVKLHTLDQALVLPALVAFTRQ